MKLTMNEAASRTTVTISAKRISLKKDDVRSLRVRTHVKAGPPGSVLCWQG
jgi:hypothetical protein